MAADCDGLEAALPVSEALALAEAGDTEIVWVQGVVTAAFPGRQGLNGFFLQSDDDTDARGSFVYAPDLGPTDWQRIEPGSHLLLAARPGTWQGRPQLQRLQSVSHCGAAPVPSPAPLGLPADAEDLERLHGRLVALPDDLVVTGNYQLGRFGSLKLSAGERLFRHRTPDDGRLHRLLLDDGSYARNPDPVPYLNDHGTRRVGDRVSAVTGVLVKAFDDWRLHPVSQPQFSDANPRPAEPDSLPGLRVAAFNVENYFVSLGRRGATDQDELQRQRDKLFAALEAQDAHLLALVEVENSRAALEDLVERLNARLPEERHYALLEGPARRGDDAIKVALIYRPTELEPLSEAETDLHPAHNRPPVFAAFRDRETDRRFVAAAVHFKAKVGCPAQGDVDRGQGCWNRLRTEQAEALLEAAADAARRHNTEQVLLAGDFNSYAGEDPIRRLQQDGFVDLVASHLPPERRYSYVFRGESGTLDYIFASDALADAITGVDIWHINADEPVFLAFDQPGADTLGSRGQPWRSSDHDPVLIGIRRDQAGD
nr:ExeM/NucH family extracellular endonuclease [Methylonatrum kenyense]